jgi:hypothetical protein
MCPEKIRNFDRDAEFCAGGDNDRREIAPNVHAG